MGSGLRVEHLTMTFTVEERRQPERASENEKSTVAVSREAVVVSVLTCGSHLKADYTS